MLRVHSEEGETLERVVFLQLAALLGGACMTVSRERSSHRLPALGFPTLGQGFLRVPGTL